MATYYVSAAAGGAGVGTIGDPWTVAQANAQADGGDTVYLRGGTYTDVRINPTGNGSPGNVLTFAAYTGETPTFASTTNNGRPVESLTGKSYITIDGITANGGPNFFTNAKFDYFVNCTSCNNITIQNCNFSFAQGWAAVNFTNCSYIYIYNNTIDAAGTWDKFDYTGVHDDAGHCIDFQNGNTYIHIKGNTFTRGGHEIMQINADYVIVEENIFDNSWGTYSGTSFVHLQGYIDPGDEIGNRAFEIDWYADYCVVQNNVFKNIPESVDQSYLATGKFTGETNIFRGNLVMNITGEGIKGSVGASHRECKNNRIYHNTFYNLGGPVWTLEAFNNRDPAPVYNKFFNNVWASILNNPPNSNWTADIVLERLDEYYPGIGNEFLNNVIAGNYFGTASPIINLNGTGSPGKISLTTAESSYAAYCYGNQSGTTPGFVNASTDYSTADFNLTSGSACRDAGAHLTTTTAAGTGVTIPVADAWFFTDGYGLITGDSIKVGSNSPVTITSITYNPDGTGTLTVNTSITYGSGDPVNLADYMTAGNTYPDAGYKPYTAQTPPALARNDSYDVGVNSAQAALSPQPSANDDNFDSYVSVSNAVNCTLDSTHVRINGTNIEFAPDTNFTGVATFDYTIQDSDSNQSTATVTVNVESSVISDMTVDEYAYFDAQPAATANYNITQEVGTGTDRIGLFCYVTEDDTQANLGASAVTLNGQAMTKVTSSGANVTDATYYSAIEWWYILEANMPAGGTTYTVATTGNGNVEAIACCFITLSHQAQAAPEAANTATATSSTEVEQSVTPTNDNVLVFTGCASGDPRTFTVGSTNADAGQVEIVDVSDTEGPTISITASRRSMQRAAAVTDGFTASSSVNRLVLSTIVVQPKYQLLDNFDGEASDVAASSHTPDTIEAGTSYVSSGATVKSTGNGDGVAFAAADDYLFLQVGVKDAVYQWDWKPGSANNHAICIFMSDDTDSYTPRNCYKVTLRIANDVVQFDKVSGSITTVLNQTTYDFDNTKEYRCEVDATSGDGTYRVYITNLTDVGDKTLVATVIDTTLTRGGYVGFAHGTRADGAGRLNRMTVSKGGTADTTGPGQVTGLTVADYSSNRIDLSWTAVTGTSLYRIYRDTSTSPSSDEANRVTDTAGIAYSDTGLTAGTTYYYQVVAMDDLYNHGTASTTGSDTTGTPADVTAPTVPSGVYLSAIDKTAYPYSVTVAWTASTDSGDGMSHYNLYVNGEFETSATGTSVALDVITPVMEIQVTAVDKAGNESSLSDKVTSYARKGPKIHSYGTGMKVGMRSGF